MGRVVGLLEGAGVVVFEDRDGPLVDSADGACAVEVAQRNFTGPPQSMLPPMSKSRVLRVSGHNHPTATLTEVSVEVQSLQVKPACVDQSLFMPVASLRQPETITALESCAGSRPLESVVASTAE